MIVIRMCSVFCLVLIASQCNALATESLSQPWTSPPFLNLRLSRTRPIDNSQADPSKAIIPVPMRYPPNPAYTEWAAQSLLPLIRKYRCIPNFAGWSMVGNNPFLSRYEMAAVLWACTSFLEGHPIEKADRSIFQALETELEAELIILKERVDALE
jgi:hypothetical protein